MLPEIKLQHTKPPYALGIATAVTTVLLAYAYCVVGTNATHNISIANIAVNLVTLFVLRIYLLRFDSAPEVTTMDWYLCINIAILLSAIFSIILRATQNPEFKEVLEIMRFFDFLVYCTYLIIGIQLGVRIRRLPDETGFLKTFGSVLVVLVPTLFLFVSFFMNVPELRDNRPLHLMLTTLAQAPPILLIIIFYKARKMRGNVLA